MKIAIMQPYFLPYIGYFQLLNYVDRFVIYDDVNFINKGWINRNYIIVNRQKKLFTISLAGASQNKLINEIEITDNFKKLKKTILMNYARAPYFEPTKDLLDNIFSFQSRNLSAFITNSLGLIVSYLGISTEILESSTLKKDNTLRGQDKIIAICREVDATTYINPIGGTNLYDRELFKKNGINLWFIKPAYTPYKQLMNEFVPGLSILDILMHNSPKKIKEFLKNFELL